jgi:hypothetical protein
MMRQLATLVHKPYWRPAEEEERDGKLVASRPAARWEGDALEDSRFRSLLEQADAKSLVVR